MTKTKVYAEQLRALGIENMYENNFFLTWDKTDDEIAAVFAVADALRDAVEAVDLPIALGFTDLDGPGRAVPHA